MLKKCTLILYYIYTSFPERYEAKSKTDTKNAHIIPSIPVGHNFADIIMNGMNEI